MCCITSAYKHHTSLSTTCTELHPSCHSLTSCWHVSEATMELRHVQVCIGMHTSLASCMSGCYYRWNFGGYLRACHILYVMYGVVSIVTNCSRDATYCWAPGQRIKCSYISHTRTASTALTPVLRNVCWCSINAPMLRQTGDSNWLVTKAKQLLWLRFEQRSVGQTFVAEVWVETRQNINKHAYWDWSTKLCYTKRMSKRQICQGVKKIHTVFALLLVIKLLWTTWLATR